MHDSSPPALAEAADAWLAPIIRNERSSWMVGTVMLSGQEGLPEDAHEGLPRDLIELPPALLVALAEAPRTVSAPALRSCIAFNITYWRYDRHKNVPKGGFKHLQELDSQLAFPRELEALAADEPSPWSRPVFRHAANDFLRTATYYFEEGQWVCAKSPEALAQVRAAVLAAKLFRKWNPDEEAVSFVQSHLGDPSRLIRIVRERGILDLEVLARVLGSPVPAIADGIL